jgi:hypothetical protein
MVAGDYTHVRNYSPPWRLVRLSVKKNEKFPGLKNHGKES